MRQVTLPNGRQVPALGQGTWHMGERADRRVAESDALRLGLDLGLSLIDTAEMYGDGGAEEVVGAALAGRRSQAFVVSKAFPQNATQARLKAACERSLRRLGIDCIDLYLLHWRGDVPLAETVAGFTALQEQGKIASWGVSNFDVADLEELAALPGGAACATDQVLYNLAARGIEFDLLPHTEAQAMPVMAYSPLGQGGGMLRNAVLRAVAERRGLRPAQIALAWAMRHPHVIAIPKAVDPAHLRDNAAAATLTLTPTELAALDTAFRPPKRKQALAVI